ncbi:MAG: hypothetical protein HY869_10055 [Chloroflexi bacterium]|nr:hypothetical protein [Chloroflexota bacterium]
MIQSRESLIEKHSLSSKLWVIFGGVLGVVFSLIVVLERTQNLFPQLGVFEKILNVVVVGYLGIGITKKCKPTKKALIGGVIFPVLLTAYFFFLPDTPKSISPTVTIGWISVGILLGILVGTAWQGALIGTIIAAITVVSIALFVHGGEIGWGSIFIPMGTIAGAGLQMAFSDFIGRRTVGNKLEIPDWLQKNKKDN